MREQAALDMFDHSSSKLSRLKDMVRQLLQRLCPNSTLGHSTVVQLLSNDVQQLNIKD